jgi:hypothetical protein
MILAEKHFAAGELAAPLDDGGEVLGDDQNIGLENVKPRAPVEHRYIPWSESIPETRGRMYDECVQALLAEHGDVVVQYVDPATGLVDIVADV